MFGEFLRNMFGSDKEQRPANLSGDEKPEMPSQPDLEKVPVSDPEKTPDMPPPPPPPPEKKAPIKREGNASLEQGQGEGE